jgi:predicted histidine transporter YuiF (NhaC family)
MLERFDCHLDEPIVHRTMYIAAIGSTVGYLVSNNFKKKKKKKKKKQKKKNKYRG